MNELIEGFPATIERWAHRTGQEYDPISYVMSITGAYRKYRTVGRVNMVDAGSMMEESRFETADLPLIIEHMRRMATPSLVDQRTRRMGCLARGNERFDRRRKHRTVEDEAIP
jgi:hypothetical protein